MKVVKTKPSAFVPPGPTPVMPSPPTAKQGLRVPVVTKGGRSKSGKVGSVSISTPHTRFQSLKRKAFIKPVDIYAGVMKSANANGSVPDQKFIHLLYNLILMGSHPEVAARAMGVQSKTFETWLQKGYEYITKDKDGIAQDPVKEGYANLLLAVDAAVAQDEIQNVAALVLGSPAWQANLAILERKYHARWGQKTTVDVSNYTVPPPDPGAPKPNQPAHNVDDMLTVLEETGILDVLAKTKQLPAGDATEVIDAELEEPAPEPPPKRIEV